MNKSIHRKLNRQKEWEDHFIGLAKQLPKEKIWHNPITQHSLRLTNHGKNFVNRDCKLDFYKFDIPELTNKNLLQLDHQFSSPYYIRSRKMIYLFGEQDSIMLSLHANNLSAYLDTLDLDY